MAKAGAQVALQAQEALAAETKGEGEVQETVEVMEAWVAAMAEWAAVGGVGIGAGAGDSGRDSCEGSEA